MESRDLVKEIKEALLSNSDATDCHVVDTMFVDDLLEHGRAHKTVSVCPIDPDEEFWVLQRFGLMKITEADAKIWNEKNEENGSVLFWSLHRRWREYAQRSVECFSQRQKLIFKSPAAAV